MPRAKWKRKQKIPSSTTKTLSYARVSSKEQEKEGFSIPAQQKLIQSYAQAHGLQIVQDYVDVETAKHSGRTNFEEMLRYLKSHPQVRIILVEKTDRLYRNLKDWVRLDELDVAIHLVKEGAILSEESRSSEKFMHGIKVLMAKNYIDNLSEEVRKGQQEKAEQGFWPNRAPMGYRNARGPDGRKKLEIDPVEGQIIANIFNWYATGNYSVKDVAEAARKQGLTFWRTGGAVPTATIHRLLRHRLYTGYFDWNGRIYKGQHSALTTKELWDRVQGVLDGRNATKAKRGKKHDLALAGLMKCGHCGCALVGDIKKSRYVYYRCTGYKGKCDEPYVREEVFIERFQAMLDRLSFDQEVLDWLSKALRQGHEDERRENEAAGRSFGLNMTASSSAWKRSTSIRLTVRSRRPSITRCPTSGACSRTKFAMTCTAKEKPTGTTWRTA
ncbi:hypothetical protein APY04_3518 [Hyphomicrobium sulfonivorans]|uniref:Recombinase family protein n=1 Tax=Hyphomicrobium sulfonivorans TaxID=121290 RepID=A0A109B8X9_HYPSL|nr:recombinase family protein [Hyphomicrobium sulfonivorans]KWT64254.1 hypothetical protein APY04_3518 [Hyphomicrobium sulfonivorans]